MHYAKNRALFQEVAYYNGSGLYINMNKILQVIIHNNSILSVGEVNTASKYAHK